MCEATLVKKMVNKAVLVMPLGDYRLVTVALLKTIKSFQHLNLVVQAGYKERNPRKAHNHNVLLAKSQNQAFLYNIYHSYQDASH